MEWMIVIFLSTGVQSVYGMPTLQACHDEVTQISHQNIDMDGKHKPFAVCVPNPNYKPTPTMKEREHE